MRRLSRATDVPEQYSSNIMTQLEDRFDSTLTQFVERLAQFAESGDTVDIAFWITLFTFDTLSKVGFSRSLDMLAAGTDASGVVYAVQHTTPVLIAFSHVNWLVKIVRSTLARAVFGQPKGAAFLEKVLHL